MRHSGGGSIVVPKPVPNSTAAGCNFAGCRSDVVEGRPVTGGRAKYGGQSPERICAKRVTRPDPTSGANSPGPAQDSQGRKQGRPVTGRPFPLSSHSFLCPATPARLCGQNYRFTAPAPQSFFPIPPSVGLICAAIPPAGGPGRTGCPLLLTGTVPTRPPRWLGGDLGHRAITNFVAAVEIWFPCEVRHNAVTLDTNAAARS